MDQRFTGDDMNRQRAIVSFANERGNYLLALDRLEESVLRYCDGVSFLGFRGEGSVGAPPHLENPYAFKIHAIEEARNRGYDQILWLDSSVVFIKDSKPLFDWITEKGFFFEEAGHWVGSWCNDRTLEYFGLTREEAMKMPMFSAGFTGLDFESPIAVEFFERWKQSMLDGQFVGSWADHRHDMTCASIIANQMGLSRQFSTGGTFLAYVGDGYDKPKDSVICNLVGL